MTLSALHTSPASLPLREVADHDPDRLAVQPGQTAAVGDPAKLNALR